MTKYVVIPYPVINPEDLATRDNRPWCDEHDQFFNECGCPKPWSTAETDKWHIVDGVAYPTVDLYVGTSMWIEPGNEKIVCHRCKQHVSISGIFTHQDIHDTTECFFKLHEDCEEPDDSTVTIKNIIVAEIK